MTSSPALAQGRGKGQDGVDFKAAFQRPTRHWSACGPWWGIAL